MPESPFEALLSQVRQIDGFVLGCLIDASTGMVLGHVQDRETLRLPVAAAGAADVANVISLMAGELAANGGLEDAIITLSGHYHLIRHFSPAPRLQFLLLVVLDRAEANLAMAHRELRDFDLNFVGRPDSGLPDHFQRV
ncbi:roadblock/LC7 domain-containing protein [Microtetraspora malaysiensis]|uniref:Roadblock/LC7 domain-containing protein n=1 Tax=Microtetraspora malaysiensis TaxID=161358 RepID=A0ABW6SSH1_9ACTN